MILNNRTQDYTMYIKRGTLLTQNEEYNLAFQDFDTAISLNESAMLAYFGRANARLKLKELMENLEDPISAHISNNKDVVDSVITEIQSYANIISDYKKTIELNPEFSYAYFNLSFAQIKTHQIQLSLASINKAIEISPRFAEAYYNRGLLHLFLKNTELACTDLSKAGELGVKEAYHVIFKYCSN